MHEIVGPDMTRVRGLDGCAHRPRHSALTVDLAHVQFRWLSDPMHPFLVHVLPATPQQGPHAPIAIAPIPLCQRLDVAFQFRVAIGPGLVLERGAVQAQ